MSSPFPGGRPLALQGRGCRRVGWEWLETPDQEANPRSITAPPALLSHTPVAIVVQDNSVFPGNR